MTTHKGLLVSIYRSDYNCPLNALDGKKQAILTDLAPIFDSSEEMPAVRIVRRNLNSGPYIHAEPMEPGTYAFGGSFIYTSDSRFSDLSKQPIPLHDRRMNLE